VVQGHVGIGRVEYLLEQDGKELGKELAAPRRLVHEGRAFAQEQQVPIGLGGVPEPVLGEHHDRLLLARLGVQEKGILPERLFRLRLDRTAEEVVVNAPDPARVPGIVPEQGLGLFSRIEIAGAPGKAAQLMLSRGKGLRLEVVEDLDAVLHHAKERIGAGKLGRLLVGEQSLLREHMQGLEGILFPERPVAAGVDELERLDEELDLTDAAVAELHVAKGLALLLHVLVDLLLHLADLGNGAEVQVLAVHEGRDAVHELPACRFVPGHGPCFEQGGPFPRLAPGLVVDLVSTQALRQRAALSFGPEPEVDAEHKAVLRALADGRGELLRNLHEILVVRDPVHCRAFRSLSAFRLAVGGIDVHEVDVGAEVQLPAAELAHGDDGEPRGHCCPILPPHQGPAELLLKVGIDMFIGRLEADLCQVRELAHGLLQVRFAHEVAQADPEHLLPAELPERPEEVLLALHALHEQGELF
jgi:hypothetical protein